MKKGVLFVLLYIVWILLTMPFGASRDIWAAVAGLVICLLVALIFGEAFTGRPHLYLSLKRYLWGLCYLPLFLYECVKANIHVAYIVLHPRLPVRPGIVKVRTRLKSMSGITALANSITLTPGTLTVEVDPSGFLYIHWITVETQDIQQASRLIVERFETILARIYE